jgi:hypothetical protein
VRDRGDSRAGLVKACREPVACGSGFTPNT